VNNKEPQSNVRLEKIIKLISERRLQRDKTEEENTGTK
jgi:hypothetical protein